MSLTSGRGETNYERQFHPSWEEEMGTFSQNAVLVWQEDRKIKGIMAFFSSCEHFHAKLKVITVLSSGQ